MTKLTLTEQEELFARDCKLINLKYEYTGYTGKEKWAIVSELSPMEIKEKYFLIIGRYSPFVYLSVEQGEVIDESYRNNHKYEMREKRKMDIFAYDDELSSQFHKELSVSFEEQFEAKEREEIAEKQEIQRLQSIRKIKIALTMLQPIQRERLVKNVCCGLSSRTIAKQEGIYYRSVDKSIIAAKKNLKKFYEML